MAASLEFATLLANRPDLRRQELRIGHVGYACSPKPADSELESAIDLCLAIDHVCQDAYRMEGVERAWAIIDRAPQGDNDDAPMAGQSVFYRPPRFIPRHEIREIIWGAGPCLA